ncbi:unnamed protein product [Fusarium graminearum]|uniref:Chromosome 4, complete genome n=2 Tax=Gibberella zeae TaxID=5518 RepID=I1S9W8_GIBZE|nr:hypothetical protein FGSG_13649 [Fusarium graminearum PH-1]ESU16433.1 hypothetical protein FGSG_13649 [Fusarium graminearum PH-1]CEF83307.1 unnamed protein product [Fusarium graminearum]CZS74030.1 unnamed protein product [Fusarium graminearum]|eukprot:XP_011327883.1 hypothetical protein FGSG_13649 [Fusarium graminearum PH-1]
MIIIAINALASKVKLNKISTLTCLPPHFTSRTIGSLTDPERDSCPQPGTSDRQHPGLLSSGRPDGPQLPLQMWGRIPAYFPPSFTELWLKAHPGDYPEKLHLTTVLLAHRCIARKTTVRHFHMHNGRLELSQLSNMELLSIVATASLSDICICILHAFFEPPFHQHGMSQINQNHLFVRGPLKLSRSHNQLQLI